MAILELKDVTKKFGGLTAVDGVNLKVEENQICALIGPNGAGKTTVFNMITGAYQVTSGDVIFNGKSICGKKPHQIVEKGIARTFQNIRLFKSATVLENVMTGFHCKTKTGMFNVIFNYRKCMQEEAECREKALEILRFLGLEDVKDLEARNIPYGHQRLLEIGRAPDEKTKKRERKPAAMSEDELHLLICSTEEKMLQAAANLDFELAAKLRDKLFELQGKAPEDMPEETVTLPQRKRRKRNKYLKA